MATVNPTGTGRYANKFAVRGIFSTWTAGAISNNQVLGTFPMPCDGRIIGLDAWATTAGATSGNTLIDVLLASGATSTTFATMYTTAANRPTIANVTTTGSFITASLPDAGATAGTGVSFHKGDIIQLIGVVSSGTGVTGVGVSLAIGMP